MIPMWQLTPLEIDSAKEASRSIKPFDGKPEKWETFSDDLVAYASFVKLNKFSIFLVKMSPIIYFS